MIRLALGLIVVAGIVGVAVAHVRINVTASMPAGLWLEGPTPATVRRGDVVSFCLPRTPTVERYVANGHCPDGLEPLFKPVVGVEGDRVSVDQAGVVAVNGVVQPASQPLERDGQGRPLTHFAPDSFLVPHDQILVLAPVAVSFDSRYFGPIPVSLVQGTVSPLLVWK